MAGAILAYEFTCSKLLEELINAGLSEEELIRIGDEVLTDYKNSVSEGMGYKDELTNVTGGINAIERIFTSKLQQKSNRTPL